MENKEKFGNQLAECIGLWLAEGDNKTKAEITFTNSQVELIKLFDQTLRLLFHNYLFNIRLYIYSPNENIIVKSPINNCIIKRYIDKRATRPYFIWRLCSKKLNKKWKDKIKLNINKKVYYKSILKGFFAGEGNIKTGKKSNRTIRIAQGKRIKSIEKILNHLKIEFRYFEKERNYYITHKFNWDKCAKINLAELHPIKKTDFWNAYNSYKEEHYKSNYLKKELFNALTKHYLPKSLALKFNRSKARIVEILIALKKEKKINNFRVKSQDYWVRNDQQVIIISKLKEKYLKLLEKYNKTQQFANYFDVDHRSAYKRLKELEELGLVKRNINKEWRRIKIEKEIITI